MRWLSRYSRARSRFERWWSTNARSSVRAPTRPDASTGEEPGKIHHELPGVPQNGLWTTYDACDTTALYLLALARVAARTEDRAFVDHHRSNLERALEYLDSHLIDDIFHEDSRQSGADRFALKVTYWKDSGAQRRRTGAGGPLSDRLRARSFPVGRGLARRCRARRLRRTDQHGREAHGAGARSVLA